MGGSRVVVVGTSLAGFRAAEELRQQGFDGEIVMVGDEHNRPYDRPPLSKQILSGRQPLDAAALAPASGEVDNLDLTWRLGTAATGLDVEGRQVRLGGGESIAYDGAVIATGAWARRLPGTDHLDGVHTLRTLDDCAAIRSHLESRQAAGAPSRIAVVGAGFIGAEVAATARGLDHDVTMVEALPVPMERALGPQVGALMADIHRDHGVDVRLGVGVVRISGGTRVESLRLTDGTDIPVDLVVVGIGVAPNTDWLDGSGLTIDNGVVCDDTCRAAPRVVAAGDVARWSSRRYGDLIRVEHWDNAVAMGAHAARTLLADMAGRKGEAYDPVPWFWSDQYDRKIQLAGRSGPDDDFEVVSGSFDERRFVAFYGRAGRLVGVLGMNQAAKVMRFRQLLETGTSWADALTAAKEAAS